MSKMYQNEPWVAECWTQAMRIIERDMQPTTFRQWVQPLQIIHMDDERIVFYTLDQFVSTVLGGRHSGLMHRAVETSFRRDYELEYVTTKQVPPQNQKPEPEKPQKDEGFTDSPLNPKYTFDAFVVGNSNRFAHSAALAVAEQPSKAYNPLFLYGGVGLGKTHLMHAIGHHILHYEPEARVLYCTGENFTNELIKAIRKKTNQQMRDKLRNVDVLMVDDIQFIAGKDSTQEEFFHTFNQLHSSGKQIIISSDRPPKDIQTLEERLRSRFEWGLIADIQRPDYETRLAILQRKADEEGLEIDDSMLSLIAERVRSNIRELEGSLNRLHAETTMQDLPLTRELVENSLQKIMGSRDKKSITPELIMRTVAEYMKVDIEQMQSPNRSRKIALPRQIAMYLIRELTQLSTTRIGEYFGGRDHTTVMHACEKVGQDMQADAEFRRLVEAIKSDLTDD